MCSKFHTPLRMGWVRVNYSPFCYASPEIIRVKVCNRQTDGQILWHHIRVHVDFFFQLNLPPPYSLHSQGIIMKMLIVVENLIKICPGLVSGGCKSHWMDCSQPNTFSNVLFIHKKTFYNKKHLFEQVCHFSFLLFCFCQPILKTVPACKFLYHLSPKVGGHRGSFLSNVCINLIIIIA